MSHKKLDKDNFLEQIVRYGYFAEQFPDCFSSDDFASHLGVLSKTVAATKAEAGKSRKNTTVPTTLSMYKNDIRNALVWGAQGIYSKYEYLETIFFDAILHEDVQDTEQKAGEKNGQYEKIGDYKVKDYTERPHEYVK